MARLHSKDDLSPHVYIRCNQRDPSGWEEVYDKLHAKLTALIGSRINNSIDAQDLATKVIADTCFIGGPYESNQALKGRLYSIARNTCTKYRKDRGWPDEIGEDHPQPPAEDPALIGRQESKFQEVVDFIRNTNGLIRAVGEKLLEGKTNKQIAEELSISNKKVAKKKDKLFDRIRKQLNF